MLRGVAKVCTIGYLCGLDSGCISSSSSSSSSSHVSVHLFVHLHVYMYVLVYFSASQPADRKNGYEEALVRRARTRQLFGLLLIPTPAFGVDFTPRMGEWVGGWDAAIWDDFSSWTCPFLVGDMGGPLSALRMQCERSATIWARASLLFGSRF